MWDKVIFIDYDVGSFGNSLLTLLVTTSSSTLGSLEYINVFSEKGDCHDIRKRYEYSNFEYQNGIVPELSKFLIDSKKYVPIIGHSYGTISSFMEKYQDANLIRINCDRHTFALTFFAGCEKFLNTFPNFDTMHIFYSRSWEDMDKTEYGIVECLAKNFYYYISNVDWYFYENASVLSLREIIDSDFKVFINLFEEKFDFKFNYNQVDDFIKKWKIANDPYISYSRKIEDITTAIKTKQSIILDNISLHDQALIIAFVCFDLNLNIDEYPFYDSYHSGWKTTNNVINLIEETYYGKTIRRKQI